MLLIRKKKYFAKQEKKIIKERNKLHIMCPNKLLPLTNYKEINYK